MRVLIVNNGVRFPKHIAALFPYDEVEVVGAATIMGTYPQAPHDLIVLTGSNHRPIPYFRTELASILAWIPEQTKPLLGICYGAELIVEAYGGKLHHLGPENKVKGFFANAIPENSFSLPSPLCLYEGHQWIIESVAPPLYPILPSARGILMFGHESRPQIGTIFHLEKYQDESDGLLVFAAILQHFNLR
ncbi:MAG: Glutamine amidotransferase class-I [Candidatus Parcubacteria bacterium]|jgi:GMP synthase-like glutamine amidotransferase